MNCMVSQPTVEELSVRIVHLQTLLRQRAWAFERVFNFYRDHRDEMYALVTDENGNYEDDSARQMIVEMDRDVDCAARELGILNAAVSK